MVASTNEHLKKKLMGIIDILKVSSQCERYQMPFRVVEQTRVLNYWIFI
jgi:hypothetical protein